MKAACRLLVGLLIAISCVAGFRGAVVSAHAVVVDVAPPSGAVVPTTPAEVVITFSEQVSLSGGSAELFDDAGVSVPVDPRVVANSVVMDLSADLGDGTYLVAWRVISPDSHPVTGTSTFSIGAASATTLAGVGLDVRLPLGVGLWRVLAMAATYAGVLVAVGVASFARHWSGRAPAGDLTLDETAFDRFDRVVTGAAAIGILGLLVALPARLVTVAGTWDGVRDTSFVVDTITGPIGQATAVSIVGLIGVMVWRPAEPSRISMLVGAGFALLAIGGFVLEGHTRTKGPTWLMVTSDFVHMAAGAAWIGGVVALAILLRRTVGATRARVVLDVSSAALWAVVAVSAAGVAMSIMVLPSFNALADTGYGLALMVKVALVVVLLAIGERNRLVLVPAIERSATMGDSEASDEAVRSLRMSVVAEIAVFVLVLVATATLVGRSPVVTTDVADAQTDATTGSVDPVSMPLSSGVGTVEAQLEPGRVGDNRLTLTLLDNGGNPLVLFDSPTVEFRERSRGIGPLTFEPQDLGGGMWEVPADIPFAGTWELSVRARTSTFDSGVATTEFVVTA